MNFFAKVMHAKFWFDRHSQYIFFKISHIVTQKFVLQLLVIDGFQIVQFVYNSVQLRHISFRSENASQIV